MVFEIGDEKSIKKINQELQKGWNVINNYKINDDNKVFVAILEKNSTKSS